LASDQPALRGAPMTAAPMRIVLSTAETHPTHRPDVAVLFGRMLPSLGVQVDLLALPAQPHPLADTAWSGGRWYRGPVARRLPAPLADGLLQLRLFALCRQGGLDAVVVRDKPVLGVVGWLAARLAGVPFCYWMSYPLPEHHLWLAARREPALPRARRLWLRLRGSLGRHLLARLLVPQADWVFVQSQAMLAQLRAGPLRHDRASAVPMGVDADALPEPASELPAACEHRTLAVYLGTLDRARGLELLVEMALLVKQVRPDFQLLVIGEADEPADVGALYAHAERRGALPWMHFTGRLPVHQALALVRRAQVGLSPVPRTPLTEVGSPTKAIEYIACGVPVVCNDQPDQALVIRASGGGMVVPLQAQAFAEATLALIGLTPAERTRRMDRAQAWVRRHRGYDVLAVSVARRLRVLSAPGGAVGRLA